MGVVETGFVFPEIVDAFLRATLRQSQPPARANENRERLTMRELTGQAVSFKYRLGFFELAAVVEDLDQTRERIREMPRPAHLARNVHRDPGFCFCTHEPPALPRDRSERGRRHCEAKCRSAAPGLDRCRCELLLGAVELVDRLERAG